MKIKLGKPDEPADLRAAKKRWLRDQPKVAKNNAGKATVADLEARVAELESVVQILAKKIL